MRKNRWRISGDEQALLGERFGFMESVAQHADHHRCDGRQGEAAYGSYAIFSANSGKQNEAQAGFGGAFARMSAYAWKGFRQYPAVMQVKPISFTSASIHSAISHIYWHENDAILTVVSPKAVAETSGLHGGSEAHR